MFRLIMTNLKHLTFGKLFLLAAAAELFFGINGGLNVKADGFDVKYFIFTVLLCAAVTLLNLGREHTDGTLRNKLTLGYSRGKIFFSLIVSAAICSTVLYTIVSVPYFLIGRSGFTESMSSEMLLGVVMIIYSTTLLITVGSAVLALCIPRLPVAAVVLLAAAIGFGIAEDGLGRPLNENKYDGYMVYYPTREEVEDEDKYPVELEKDENGKWVYAQFREQPNEFYVSGTKRIVYKTLYFLDPYAQFRTVERVMRLYDFDDEELEVDLAALDAMGEDIDFRWEIYRNYGYLPLYSGAFILVLLIGGVLVFRKININ